MRFYYAHKVTLLRTVHHPQKSKTKNSTVLRSGFSSADPAAAIGNALAACGIIISTKIRQFPGNFSCFSSGTYAILKLMQYCKSAAQEAERGQNHEQVAEYISFGVREFR
jgi:hypothetical protein